MDLIPSPENVTKPMSLNCMNVLSNDSMKLSKLKIHLEMKHKEKENEPVEYFRQLKPRPNALDFSLYIARQMSSIVECC